MKEALVLYTKQRYNKVMKHSDSIKAFSFHENQLLLVNRSNMYDLGMQLQKPPDHSNRKGGFL